MHHKCLKQKFFNMIHQIWLNQKELDISDEDLKKIGDLMIQTKKRLIKDEAEIDTLIVDIMAKLWEKPNPKELDSLIDKKYAIKKERAKALVEAYLSLVKMLDEEQEKKLKEIYKEGMEEKKGKCCE